MVIKLKQKAFSLLVVGLFALTASGIGIFMQTNLLEGNSANAIQMMCPTADGSGGC